MNLIDGFAPAAGDAFDVFDFDSATGSFTLELPALADGLTWDATSLLVSGVLSVRNSAELPADFNGDGQVDGEERE